MLLATVGAGGAGRNSDHVGLGSPGRLLAYSRISAPIEIAVGSLNGRLVVQRCGARFQRRRIRRCIA